MPKKNNKTELTIEEKLNQALIPIAEQPYEIPENWCWVRLGKILYLIQDKYNPQEERSSNLKISPFLKGNGCDSNQGDFNKEEKISLSAKADIPLYERGYIDNPIEADFKIKYIGLEHIEKDGGITDYGYVDEVKSPKNVFKKGDLLYGKLRPYLNKHDVAYLDGVCSTDILVYRSIEPITTKFVNYLFSTGNFIQYAIENSHGINLPRISSKDIAIYPLPLPPLPEQQRIVDLIERLFAKLDEAKEKVQTAIDSFELRKAAILHKAFTGELTRRWREEKEQNAENKRAGERRAESGELGKTPFNKGSNETTGEDALKPLLEEGWLRSNRGGDGIRSKSCSIEQSSSQADWIATQSTTACNDDSTGGSDTLSLNKVYSSSVTSPQGEALETDDQPYPIPETWQWVKLGKVCRFIGGGTPSKKETTYWNGNIPWASVKDIKGDYLYQTIDSITEDGLNNSSSNLCEINDLILITRIEPGKTIISKIKTAINQDLKIVKSNLPSDYLHYYFLRFKQELEQQSSGTTVKGVTIQTVENMSLPLPPLPEQKEIVRILDTLLAKSDKAKELAENALENIETLKKTILAKAFRGLLGTNRADEASSIELLKEVL